MPTNNVRKISYNVDNNSDNKDNFKGVALFFFLFFFFIHQNYEEINDNFAVSEYLKKLHRQKSK